MNNVADIIANLEKTHEACGAITGTQLRQLIDDLKRANDSDGRKRLGKTVCIGLDPDWRGIITAVKMYMDGTMQYKVEWRVGRNFANRWFSAGELVAFQQLEKK